MIPNGLVTSTGDLGENAAERIVLAVDGAKVQVRVRKCVLSAAQQPVNTAISLVCSHKRGGRTKVRPFCFSSPAREAFPPRPSLLVRFDPARCTRLADDSLPRDTE